MMENKIDVLGVGVDKLDMEEALGVLLQFLEEGGPHAVYTPNSEIVMRAYRDEEFCKLLNTAELIVPDGIGVVYASRILKDPLAERVGGFDLSARLIEAVSDGSRSLYFFGGKPGVAEQAKARLTLQYPKLRVCGCSDGYFDEKKEKKIIADIQEKQPDILFVCLGAPKQEQWIHDHKAELGAKILMGIGGSLDVYAKVARRAPKSFQNLGLEWLYRLAKEPKRIGRAMELPKFGMAVVMHGKRVKKQ